MIVEAEFKLIEYRNKFEGWLIGAIISGLFFCCAIIDFSTLEINSRSGVLLFIMICIPFPICLLCSFVYYILYRIQYKIFKILSLL